MSPSKVHPATSISTTLAAGGLLWANLRVSGIARDFGVEPLTSGSPLTRFYFSRGWPCSPLLFSPIQRMDFQGTDFAVGLALLLNGVAAGLILMGVAFVCEWFVRRLRRAAQPRAVADPASLRRPS